ncbi:hypothetical protein KXD40_007334 [Peronospora effusa]|nr:hypothetical protein KXD40_007334 [Peronospora effusa]
MSAADGTSNIKNKNSHCGICGSDLHTIESVGDLWTCPCVVGHEIVGEVTLAGPDVKIRNCVGVEGPLGSMQRILSGDHAYCTHRVLTYNDKYKKNGATSDRGHPDYVRVAHEDAFKILDNIPFDGAAPLLCDDTTDSVKPDKRVGVEDVNGLGHKFAHAMGVDAVMALFSLTKKEQKMADSGATEFVVDRKKKQAATVIGLTDVLRSSYAKVLTAIALLACVASRVATSAWIPQDVMRSSRALKAAHTPVQANRNLRLNAAKSDHTYNFEKRMLPLKVMGQPVALEIIGGFSQRVEGVTNLEQKEYVYNSLIKLFLNPGDDYKLARLLDAEAKIKEMTAFAKNLQAAQVRYWHSQGMSAADVFDFLQLGTSKEKLFKNPLFHRLIDFINKFNNEVLAKTLVEGANTAGKDSIAPKLLLMRLLKGQLDGESKRTVLNLAKLNTGSQRMNGPLKVTFRKFSGFFTRIDSQWNDLTQLK